MEITIEKHNPIWKTKFIELEKTLTTVLEKLTPQIEHIGSTSVPELSAKPIIDIAIGLDSKEQLDQVIQLMIDKGFVYISAFNSIMPERRFFVNLKNRGDFKSEYSNIDKIPNEELHKNKIANIHIWVLNSYEWTRHIAFRDYLKYNSKVKNEYQSLKEKLSKKSWSDGNDYNNAKNDFIKREELNAIKWYNEKHR